MFSYARFHGFSQNLHVTVICLKFQYNVKELKGKSLSEARYQEPEQWDTR